jgi:predicted nucleic acid-binding protein
MAKDAVDSSVLVGAIVESEADHLDCVALLRKGGFVVNTHALAETFSALTGGRLKFQFAPAAALQAIERAVLPRVDAVALATPECLSALSEAHERGIRGGAIYDYLHLASARGRAAPRLYTLNLGHFRAFWRPGDPEIVRAAPANVRLRQGNLSGQWIMRFQPDRQKSMNQVHQCLADPNVEANWTRVGMFGGGKAQNGGYAPGTNI